MRKALYVMISIIIGGIALSGCSDDELVASPEVPYRMVLNDSVYHNGDSLYGYVEVIEESVTPGTEVKKIDCRLGNIVIGTVENQMVCPFGVRLKDKPAGTHIFSVIIKCQAPDCDETYWRYDYKMINIEE